MKKVSPDDWRPADGLILEPVSEIAVRSNFNSIVLAGPGAGKTELLAQRASYLLQTGLCSRSQRILAISFKRDSARNLQERVKKRCGKELSRRFDSLTFDAFAKGILDRFIEALPETWKPTPNYEIDFSLTNKRPWQGLLEQLIGRSGFHARDIEELKGSSLLKRKVFSLLPDEAFDAGSADHIAAVEIWKILLHEKSPSVLNFQMIGRLVLVILQSNPMLLKALRMTYSHVFMDEFQDTTGIQYNLTKECFRESSAILTAVGDPKQRIMKWAGALDGVFASFKTDFSAEILRPICNYRSAPELVRIQNILARAIEGNETPNVESRNTSGTDGECRSLVFSSHESEADVLSEFIQEWMTQDTLGPRDICILSRQTPEKYATTLQNKLNEAGIKARIESELQDLLSEPVIDMLLAILKLIVKKKDPNAWNVATEELQRLHGVPDDVKTLKQLENELTGFLKSKRNGLPQLSSKKEVLELFEELLTFYDKTLLISCYPQYKQGSFLRETLEKSAKYLLEYYESHQSWEKAIDEFEGKDSIPIMTMHKSKGLEYHTVIFIGLEDGALWGYSGNAAEETCGFFVALSRAKQRVIFTFSKIREGVNPWSNAQTVKNILPLYNLLKDAGITPEKIELSA